MNFRLPILAWTCLSVAALAAPDPATANHAADMQKGLALFDGGVAQLLTEHCVKCHGGETMLHGAKP